eukprot:15737-Pleurochrysis_carterae.AAC.1
MPLLPACAPLCNEDTPLAAAGHPDEPVWSLARGLQHAAGGAAGARRRLSAPRAQADAGAALQGRQGAAPPEDVHHRAQGEGPAAGAVEPVQPRERRLHACRATLWRRARAGRVLNHIPLRLYVQDAQRRFRVHQGSRQGRQRGQALALGRPPRIPQDPRHHAGRAVRGALALSREARTHVAGSRTTTPLFPRFQPPDCQCAVLKRGNHRARTVSGTHRSQRVWSRIRMAREGRLHFG